MPSIAALQKLLDDVRDALDSGKFQFIPRGKNIRTLSQLGLTVADIKDEIRSLTPSHYHTGPMLDRRDPHSDHLWVFKKRIEGEIIYIKFKVIYQADGSLTVISFHIDE